MTTMNKTITIHVDAPEPSSVLDVEGACDYGVRITIAQGRGARFFDGQVTLAPDRLNSGALRPTGDSLDCWISAGLLPAIDELSGMDRRRAIDALESGESTTEFTIEAEL